MRERVQRVLASGRRGLLEHICLDRRVPATAEYPPGAPSIVFSADAGGAQNERGERKGERLDNGVSSPAQRFSPLIGRRYIRICGYLEPAATATVVERDSDRLVRQPGFVM